MFEWTSQRTRLTQTRRLRTAHFPIPHPVLLQPHHHHHTFILSSHCHSISASLPPPDDAAHPFHHPHLQHSTDKASTTALERIMPPYGDAPPPTATAVRPAAPLPPPATLLDAPPAPPSKPRSSFHLPSWPRIQHFLIRNALPLGFLFGLIWALLWPAPGQAVAEIVIGKTASNQKGWRIVEVINNCFVFLVSGLTLRMSDFHSLVRRGEGRGGREGREGGEEGARKEEGT